MLQGLWDGFSVEGGVEMAIQIFEWPRDLIRPTTQGWNLDARSRSGGETLTGDEQIVTSGLGRWRANATFNLRTPEQIRAFRKLAWQLDGRTNAMLIGPCDCRNGNRPGNVFNNIPYSQTGELTVLHSDDTGFSQGGYVPTTRAEYIAGGHVISLDMHNPSGVNPIELYEGTFIGFGDRIYGIIGITGGVNVKDITVVPRLRETIPINTAAKLCDARAPMRLIADDGMFLELELARRSEVTVEIVEVW